TQGDERLRAMLVADALEAAAGKVQRLVPARLAESCQRIGRTQRQVGRFGYVGSPDQRLGQPMRMPVIVEAIASLDAQAAFVRGAVGTIDRNDVVVLHVQLDPTTDTAIWADRGYLFHLATSDSCPCQAH